MSILGLYTYPRWEDGPDDDLDFDFEDNNPAMPPELLSAVSGAVWWTAAPILDTDD